MNEREAREQINRLLMDNASALARLNAHLQATIPAYVEEFATTGQILASASSTLKVPPTRDTYFKCTGIFASVPLNCTSASLQLGSQFILPIQNTTFLLTPVQRILTSTDLRQLSFTCGAANGGSAFVWLYGEAVPKYGVI